MIVYKLLGHPIVQKYYETKEGQKEISETTLDENQENVSQSPSTSCIVQSMSIGL